MPEAVAGLRARGYRRVAVATYLLTPGRYADSLAAAGAWAVSEPLADHPLVARLVLRRYAVATASVVAGCGVLVGAGERRGVPVADGAVGLGQRGVDLAAGAEAAAGLPHGG